MRPFRPTPPPPSQQDGEGGLPLGRISRPALFVIIPGVNTVLQNLTHERVICHNELLITKPDSPQLKTAMVAPPRCSRHILMPIQRLPGGSVGTGRHGSPPGLCVGLVCARLYLFECVCVHHPTISAEDAARPRLLSNGGETEERWEKRKIS